MKLRNLFCAIALLAVAFNALGSLTQWPSNWAVWNCSHSAFDPVQINDEVRWVGHVTNLCDGEAFVTITYDWPGDSPTTVSSFFVPVGWSVPLQASYDVNESTAANPVWRMSFEMIGVVDGEIHSGFIALGGTLNVQQAVASSGWKKKKR